jgi:hypothetical protein
VCRIGLRCSFLFHFPYFLTIVLIFKEYSKIGFLFNSPHCHLYFILQSSTIKSTLLLLLILVQYVLCAMFLIRKQLDKSLEGPHRMAKNIIIQTQYKSFSESHAPTLMLNHFGVEKGVSWDIRRAAFKYKVFEGFYQYP